MRNKLLNLQTLTSIQRRRLFSKPTLSRHYLSNVC